MKTFLNTLYQFFFPHLCLGCLQQIPSEASFMCYKCADSLPKSNYHLTQYNQMYDSIVEQYSVQAACGFYLFQSQSSLRNLIHHLKYKGNAELGIFLGQKIGSGLLENPIYKTVDVLVPIPLHIKKQQQRGYNQSEKITQGVANILQKPINTKVVIRQKNTMSQASLENSTARLRNMEDSFIVHQAQCLENKHVLLIDDVFTTGATILACIKALKEIKQIKISVVTLAVAVS